MLHRPGNDLTISPELQRWLEGGDAPSMEPWGEIEATIYPDVFTRFLEEIAEIAEIARTK